MEGLNILKLIMKGGFLKVTDKDTVNLNKQLTNDCKAINSMEDLMFTSSTPPPPPPPPPLPEQ